MRLITLLTGYAAGLAIAIKYRKNTGISRLQSSSATPGAFIDNLLDEVIDIHRDIFGDLKGLSQIHFSDVRTFEDLQNRVSEFVSQMSSEGEMYMQKIYATKTQNQEEIIKSLQEFFQNYEIRLLAARDKALTFTDTSEDMIHTWMQSVQQDIQSIKKQITLKFEHTADAAQKDV